MPVKHLDAKGTNMVRISHDASILPVILGGDIGAYAIGREFHEAYGCKAISLIQEPIGIIKHSRILNTFAAPPPSRRRSAITCAASRCATAIRPWC